LTTDELRARLARLPRVGLSHLPTPLEPLPRLSAALGDVEIWIKRDDCTGLAFGGNKARQLEFTIGEAVAQGADCVIQGAGAQSNHCRQAAAAAAKLGLGCHLVLARDERGDGSDASAEAPQGNLLLHRLLGAKIHWTDAPLGAPLEAEKVALAARLRAQGHRPYVIGGSRAKLLSAAGYALELCELVEQCATAGLTTGRSAQPGPDYLYLATTGATHAGLVLGARALGLEFAIQAIAQIAWGVDVPSVVAEIAGELAAELEIDVAIEPASIRHTEEYVGPGYGILSREARVAIELVARTEGVLLDPFYTGKAMAGLIAHVRKGIVRPGSRVVFIHTGGLPALFTEAAELTA
jgi:1-aminocyclopropane-1-carboxylate deaminase/D-cysteine desulfhydrase-like pyridoxal-dependent ACC family enzyme